jgi:RNA polymerase sigma-70 factor (ECF subfamily)
MDHVDETERPFDAHGSGNTPSPGSLCDALYEELHRLAGEYFRSQRIGHTLQPTALVNEAYLKLAEKTRIEWESRAHFLAVAAKAMRQILIDHARGRATVKRGAGRCRVTMAEGMTPITETDPELLDLDEALTKLAAMDARQSRIVELRFFGGLTMEEIAGVLDLSKTTVETEWRMARAWLRRELSGGSTP